MDLKEKFKNRFDNWTNVLVGLGGKQDKRRRTEFDNISVYSDEQLSAMYIDDGLSHKVISVVPDDMTKEWIEIKVSNDKDNKKHNLITDKLTKLQAQKNISDIMKWSRCLGGGVLLLGIMDGRKLSEPVNLNRIKSLDYLIPIDRSNIYIDMSEFYDDPTSPNFGKVKVFNLDIPLKQNNTIMPNIRIHHTRVIEFYGEQVPDAYPNLTSDYKYWGVPIMQYIYNQMQNLSGISDSIANLMYEFVVPKYKLSGLSEMMSMPNGHQGVIKRMEVINACKSMLNAVILDAEHEDFTRDSASVAGMADLLDKFMLFLSSVTNIPEIKLFGKSTSGLNSTGENDLKNYYDNIKSHQTNELTMPIDKLINYIALSKEININPDDVQWKFRPLTQLTRLQEAELEKTEAETEKIKAQTEKIYIETGIKDPAQVLSEMEAEQEVME